MSAKVRLIRIHGYICLGDPKKPGENMTPCERILEASPTTGTMESPGTSGNAAVRPGPAVRWAADIARQIGRSWFRILWIFCGCGKRMRARNHLARVLLFYDTFQCFPVCAPPVTKDLDFIAEAEVFYTQVLVILGVFGLFNLAPGLHTVF